MITELICTQPSLSSMGMREDLAAGRKGRRGSRGLVSDQCVLAVMYLQWMNCRRPCYCLGLDTCS